MLLEELSTSLELLDFPRSSDLCHMDLALGNVFLGVMAAFQYEREGRHAV